jgi:hypothetical protein
MNQQAKPTILVSPDMGPFSLYILNSKIQLPLHWCAPLWLYSCSRPPYYLTYKQNENIEIK